MSKKLKNSLVIIIILALSVGCGFIYDLIYTSLLEKNHPILYEEYVNEASYKYSIPDYIIYGNIKARSDFETGLVGDGGRTGLMQLTGEQYEVLATELGCYVDAGLLFDPSTSVNIGTYWISKLYDKYKSFTAVYAAMYIGEETVDGWLSDESLVDENGKLLKIPDRDTEKYVERVMSAIEVYRDLDN